MVFVDDIMAGGGTDTVEEAGKNLKEMERKKGYTFNVGEGKTQYLTIRNGKKPEEEPEIELTNGKVMKTEEYKFLGNWIDSKGTVERQLDEVERRTIGMTRELTRLTNDSELGRCATDAKLIMYEKTVVPSLTFNLEMWTKLRQGDWDRLEKIQAKALKSIFCLPNSTPYWGILGETGIWPLKSVVIYHRLMYMHNIMNSEDSRLAKRIVMGQQEIEGENWTRETERIGKEYNIDMDKVTEKKKSEWKREIKDEIEKEIEGMWIQKAKSMKKMRHVKEGKFGKRKYMMESTTLHN